MNYYQTQSPVTDPAEFISFYEKLPTDIESLCGIVQGLLIHETDGKLFNYEISTLRQQETNLRLVRKMLSRIFEMQDSNILIPREPPQRLVATCRDFACLLCSFLRYRQIPARVRIGFATYIYPNTHFYSDHALVEYWNSHSQKWQRVDARTSAYHIKQKRHIIDFNIYDVPENRFITAASAWELSRKNKVPADWFGYGIINRVSGWWYLRNKLMQDFAALNKFEPLLWDAWRYMVEQAPGQMPTPEQMLSMDDLAKITMKIDFSDIDRLRAFYNNSPRLKVPNTILCASPTLGIHEQFLNYV